jgi:hypothetical protein
MFVRAVKTSTRQISACSPRWPPARMAYLRVRGSPGSISALLTTLSRYWLPCRNMASQMRCDLTVCDLAARPSIS